MRPLVLLGRCWQLVSVRHPHRRRDRRGPVHPRGRDRSAPPPGRPTSGNPLDDADAFRDEVGRSWFLPPTDE